MKRRAEPQFFTVRDGRGDYLGTYRAMKSREAIDLFLCDQARVASTFRKSQPMPRFTGLAAAVEEIS